MTSCAPSAPGASCSSPRDCRRGESLLPGSSQGSGQGGSRGGHRPAGPRPSIRQAFTLRLFFPAHFAINVAAIRPSDRSLHAEPATDADGLAHGGRARRAGRGTGCGRLPDPDVPEALAGLVYEFFVDPEDPSRLNPDDPRDTVGARDGVAVRPALGSKSHEGLRFDREGNFYGIAEANPGGIFRFVPDHVGDLSAGTLQVLVTENGHDGAGTWADIDDAAAGVNAQAAAIAMGGNGYNRPEDVETGESTGVDRNNGGNTLYVAITGTDEVLAVDLSDTDAPFAYVYVVAGGNVSAAFDSPDNLALDRRGNLAIAEDVSEPVAGDDIWIAEPSSGGEGPLPASTVGRFASLKDCGGEPTGIYFALTGTSRHTRQGPFASFVNDRSLFVNRQHSLDGTTLDQFVSIVPLRRH